MHAAGFVLVGGHSSRMGRDKALLPGRSGALAQELASRVEKAAGQVALIGNPERYRCFGFDCLPDLRPGQGPLAGVESALASGRGELNLIIACDLPGVEVQWMRKLLKQSDETGAECVATRDASRRLHPLCAVYRNSCLAKVQNALDAGRMAMMDVLRELKTVVMETERELWNVNTQEEWRAWQMRPEAIGRADGH